MSLIEVTENSDLTVKL